MALNGIPISDDQCIGDSLVTINNAFVSLDASVLTLSSTANSLSAFNVFDSPTIELDWNASTRTLSADVKQDSIRYSHLASWQTLSGSPTLSAEAVQQRLVKAWVNFNGTTSPGTIRSSFNVSSVTRNSTGNFTINFTTPMASSNYVIAGSPDQTNDSTGYSHYESIVSATVNGFTILTSGIANGAYVCNPVTIRYCVIGN
jgi:hypothetical protein